MITKWILNILNQVLDKKKQEVVRLRWQKARLQKELDKLKKQ